MLILEENRNIHVAKFLLGATHGGAKACGL